MAFCVQCGSKVGDADQFCAKCGAPQKVAAGSRAGGPRAGAQQVHNPFSGISARNASLLCYIPWVGWIAAIVVLASQQFRNDARVRFHAFQGLYMFVAWLMVQWVFTPFLYASSWFFGMPFHRLGGDLLQLAVFVGWIFMLVKVSHDESYKLPVIGDLAERSVSEQRS
jgi:uncharacterized membrane protein